ncbi:MAG TPA: nitroreductase, partial [Mycobacterium sp.]|nr:nitroreductase [Mycobacterium sp.]
VKVFNKRVLNPVMLRLAGRRHWYASVIDHTGRRTGRHYATPVVADPVPGGVIVPLPYGTDVDWLRNVLAAGHANLRTRGTTYAVERPEIIDASAAAPLLPPARRRLLTRFGVQHFLTMKITPRAVA